MEFVRFICIWILLMAVAALRSPTSLLNKVADGDPEALAALALLALLVTCASWLVHLILNRVLIGRMPRDAAVAPLPPMAKGVLVWLAVAGGVFFIEPALALAVVLIGMLIDRKFCWLADGIWSTRLPGRIIAVAAQYQLNFRLACPGRVYEIGRSTSGEPAAVKQGTAATAVQHLSIDPCYRLASTLGASATVGGVCGELSALSMARLPSSS